MKKSTVFSLMAAGLALGFVACNNSGDGANGKDTTATTSTTTVTNTSNYAARADTVRNNVKAGYYLNPRTGKAYTNLTVDTLTGAMTDETGQPVRRYVDKRNWSVYDAMSWDTVGSAEMRDGSLMYRDAKGDWESYDQRWAEDSAMNMSNGNNMGNGDMNNGSMSDTSSMMSSGSSSNPKVKVSDKGNKVKIKTPNH